MVSGRKGRKRSVLFSVMLLFVTLLSACAVSTGNAAASAAEAAESGSDEGIYLTAVDDEPDTVDFQCTSIYYTVAQNVFNRLVEMERNESGSVEILPSLAESWTVSEDRRSYRFRLRDQVRFSNGSPLTASDVYYTICRLLTHPDSCNYNIVELIEGASRLRKGESGTLEGFEIHSDLEFTITLQQPFEAFLACMTMPGASILDEETTEEAGERFGTDPAWTIGTGSFILTSWMPGKGMLLTANPDCFAGPPACAGLDLRFMSDPEEIMTMFEDGELDILDLDDLGDLAEFFIHGDIYQESLKVVQQIGITYIALNETIEPLNMPEVRKALQLALNRSVLLDAVYSGRGFVENGIYPHGLYGFNPELPEIPYDPEEARRLLGLAGLEDGFDLTVSVRSSSTQWEMTLMRLIANMWEKIGIRADVEVLEESEFMKLRKSGALPCYAATWTADYNDPDNIVYTFYGSKENTVYRSLNYWNEDVMERVRNARMIADAKARIDEYRDLEQIIVQEDAAWVPLFSRLRYYVTSERLSGFRASWNGSVKNNYRGMSVA